MKIFCVSIFSPRLRVYRGRIVQVLRKKSTFIRRFMELVALPQTSDKAGRDQRSSDQAKSSPGRTKFIPKASSMLSEKDQVKIRLIDRFSGKVLHPEQTRTVKNEW